jgi:SAM-dependent methyltransferase
MTLEARYDGHADWYDSWNRPQAERNAAAIRELLGPGDGPCLDLGCGSGHYFDVIASTGRTAIGLDRSADQLRIAQSRSRRRDRGSKRGQRRHQFRYHKIEKFLPPCLSHRRTPLP